MEDVRQPIGANFFGPPALEHFVSCMRRVCGSNDHFWHMM
jgi:hypothetical protein